MIAEDCRSSKRSGRVVKVSRPPPRLTADTRTYCWLAELAALASSACLLAEVLRPLVLEEEEELLWEDDWASPASAALVELRRERRPPPAVVEEAEGVPLAEEAPWEDDKSSTVTLEGLRRGASSLVLLAPGLRRRAAAVLPLARGPTPAPAPRA